MMSDKDVNHLTKEDIASNLIQIQYYILQYLIIIKVTIIDTKVSVAAQI